MTTYSKEMRHMTVYQRAIPYVLILLLSLAVLVAVFGAEMWGAGGQPTRSAEMWGAGGFSAPSPTPNEMWGS